MTPEEFYQQLEQQNIHLTQGQKSNLSAILSFL